MKKTFKDQISLKNRYVEIMLLQAKEYVKEINYGKNTKLHNHHIFTINSCWIYFSRLYINLNYFSSILCNTKK